MCNDKIYSLFPMIGVEHLVRSAPDHTPMLPYHSINALACVPSTYRALVAILVLNTHSKKEQVVMVFFISTS